jgi:hypothetical protein
MALSGNKVAAKRIVAQLQRLSKHAYVSPWLFAIIYPDLGEKDNALMWLEKCYEGREHDLVFSKAWPMFDSLRSDTCEVRLGPRSAYCYPAALFPVGFIAPSITSSASRHRTSGPVNPAFVSSSIQSATVHSSTPPEGREPSSLMWL